MSRFAANPRKKTFPGGGAFFLRALPSDYPEREGEPLCGEPSQIKKPLPGGGVGGGAKSHPNRGGLNSASTPMSMHIATATPKI